MTWEWESETDSGTLICRPLVPERFDDELEVFGETGVARKCACMHWRRPDGGYPDERPAEDRFREVTELGPPPGLVGYLDGDPIGWVSLGPRDDFPTLNRSRMLAPVDDTPVWSVNCFVTKVGYRRQGVGDAMLQAAIEYARHLGVEVLEGYPWDAPTTSPVNIYTGTRGMFSGAEWVEVERRKPHRPILRLLVQMRNANCP